MDVREIRAFHTVVQNGSMLRAAEVLGVTQPTISRQIRSIEEEMNLQLFYRGKSGVDLTPAGEEFLALTKGILLDLERAIDIVQTRFSRKSVFKIACTQTTAHAILAPFMAETNPPIIDLMIVDAAEADSRLESGADLAITTLRPPPDRAATKVTDLNVWVQAPADNLEALASQSQYLDLEIFQDEEWILPRTGVYDAIFSAFKNIPADLRRRYVTTGVVAQSLAANGYGYALVTELPGLGLDARLARAQGTPVFCPLNATWDTRHEAGAELLDIATRLGHWLRTSETAKNMTPQNTVWRSS